MSVLMTPFLTHAQDTLVYKDKSIELVKVVEVLPREVKYKLADYPDGPTFVVFKKKLNSILYANGYKQFFKSKEPTLEEKRNSVYSRRTPLRSNAITIQRGIHEIPEYSTPYKTRHFITWCGFISILDRSKIKYEDANLNYNSTMYGPIIGFDLIELLSAHVPLYIKGGVNIMYVTSTWQDIFYTSNYDIISGKQSFLRITTPFSLGYAFETNKVKIIPSAGISFHVNAISNVYIKDRYYKYKIKDEYRAFAMSAETGVDFLFESGWYLGVGFSIEFLPSYRIKNISERFMQFEAKFGYNF